MFYILGIGFFIVPALAVILFIVSLICFLNVKNKKKHSPEKVTPEKFQNTRTFLIVSSVIASVSVASLLLIIWFVQGVIIHM